MTGPRIGALFAGYGGLEMGVQSILGGDLAWYSEIDKGALKILTHRHPDVPNVGDVTTVKWTPDCPTCGDPLALYNRDVPEGRGYYCPRDGWFDLDIRFADPDAARIPDPVEILTGGSPCQDLSHAGKRAGMTVGTRSNLWVAMREAIAQLRPGLVVWENVRGAYSAEADSGLEFCAGCMGDAWYRGAALRALGRVLGDLSDLGYDAGWHGLRAADVGAPHGRMRVFVVAYTSGDAGRFGYGDGAATSHGNSKGCGRVGWEHSVRRDVDGRGGADGPRTATEPAALLPTPRIGGQGANDAELRRNSPSLVETTLVRGLLPTPRATDGTKGGPNQRGSSGDLMLPSAVALLPTPASQEPGGTREQYHARLKAADGRDSTFTPLSMVSNWGDYADAIARWENVLGRPAPAPTMTSTKGNPQLAPAFVEWMMGLPAGWVTDTPGITRNEALKALGNGVVPQQAEAALRVLLHTLERAA